MVRIKGWRKRSTPPRELLARADPDNFKNVWSSDSNWLFIVEDGFGGYILGELGYSQMSEPVILFRSEKKKALEEKAADYMRRHPNG